MICQRCGQEIDGESYERFGEVLCEDCYLDALTPPKACDPWAVHSAKGLESSQDELPPSQRKILDRLAQGPVEVSRMARELSLSPDELSRDLAALRHMEKVRAFPLGEQRFLILFHQANPDWAEA